MQWEGMPDDGWVVDVTTRACQCRFYMKYNMCPHIIEATKLLGLPCPGFKTQRRRFQSRDKQSTQRRVRQEIIDEQSSHSQSSTSGGIVLPIFRASISAGLTTEAELHEHIGVESATSAPLSRISNETAYPDYSSVSAPVQLTAGQIVHDFTARVEYTDSPAAPPPATHPVVSVHLLQSSVVGTRRYNARSESPLRQMPTSDPFNAVRPTSRESCEHTKRRRY
ncbi:Zinc finger, SWIM-type [Phytophthora cactorum]|nr:Zinc finger, SWIM-type [Phytophthora cactorum]